jgi:hypothetical protein
MDYDNQSSTPPSDAMDYCSDDYAFDGSLMQLLHNTTNGWWHYQPITVYRYRYNNDGFDGNHLETIDTEWWTHCWFDV